MFVEFHFYFILIFLSFRKYPDFERKGKILALFDLTLEKLAGSSIEFSSLQLSSQMVTLSLELTSSPWSRNISNLKQSCGNWRNLLCVVFVWKGRRTSFSVVVTAHVRFV